MKMVDMKTKARVERPVKEFKSKLAAVLIIAACAIGGFLIPTVIFYLCGAFDPVQPMVRFGGN